MDQLSALLNTLKEYQLEVISVTDNHVKVAKNYEIEIEANGIYKLLDAGYIVAPFNDVTALCKFIVKFS